MKAAKFGGVATRGKLDPDELHVKATRQGMDYITSFRTFSIFSHTISP